jgi:CRP-like cAMP-binding protein
MQTQREVVDILGSLALFADLPRPQLEAVSHIFEEQWFNEGERILRQGFTGAGFYVILDGEAALLVDGKEQGRLGRGDFFGEISILLGEPPTADVIAAGALRCLVLAGSSVQEFLESNPRVMFRVLQAEAVKLRKTLR